jgi:lysophospholipase L1-like esterase
VASLVDRLPFRPGDLVAVIGDSITDDLLSWFHLIENMVELRRKYEQIRFLNLAFSGDTTAHMLSRMLPLVQAKPQWIFCLAGTNDARRIGCQPFKPAVSPAETELNLAAMRQFAHSETQARWIWLTPPPMLADKVQADAYFRESELCWQPADLEAAAEATRRQPGPFIDLFPVLGNPPDPAYLEEDGLHPSPAGQARIAQTVLEFLCNEEFEI